jgi:hypothetical protein
VAVALHNRYRWPLLRAALMRGQSVVLTVHGRCMWPALRPGDRARIVALTTDQACVGKIIACVHGDRCVAHRVVELGHDLHGGTFVRCQADASARLDARVALRDVVGEVVEVERRGRTLRLARSPSPISRLLTRTRPVLTWLRRASAS